MQKGDPSRCFEGLRLKDLEIPPRDSLLGYHHELSLSLNDNLGCLNNSIRV